MNTESQQQLIERVAALNQKLTAERQRREKAERDYKICCTMRDNHSKQLEVVLSIRIELEQQLLSALAAMAAIEGVIKASDNIGSVGLADAIEICRRRDLSLLHQHDAEVRKPLVDVLNELLSQSTDPNAKTGEFDTTAGRARRLLDALAKVKP